MFRGQGKDRVERPGLRVEGLGCVDQIMALWDPTIEPLPENLLKLVCLKSTI